MGRPRKETQQEVGKASAGLLPKLTNHTRKASATPAAELATKASATPAAELATKPSALDKKELAMRAEIENIENSIAETEHLMQQATATEKVAMAKSIERMKSNLDYLRKALDNYMSLLAINPDPVPPDYMVLASCLDKYKESKIAGIDKARVIIREAEQKIEETESRLEKATAEMDPEAIKQYSSQLEDLKKQREFLQPALDKASTAEEIPAGKLREEWAAICNLFLPEWTLRLKRIETAANEYKAAQRDALGLFGFLKATRSEMQRRGKEAGCPDNIEQNNAVFSGVVKGGDAIFFSEKERTALNDAIFRYTPYGARL